MVVHERSGSLTGALTSALLFGAGAVAAYEYLSGPLPARSEVPREAPGIDAEDAFTVGLARTPDARGRLRAIVARRDGAWSRSCEGAGALSEPRIAASPSGAVVLGLTFEGAVDCGAGAILAAGGAGDLDALVVGLDRRGKVRWTVTASDLGAQTIAAVALDPWGNALVAGSFEGTVELGGAPMTADSTRDVLLAKLDADGQLVWQRHFGGGRSFGVDVDATPAGRVLLLARGSSPIDFGDGARRDPGATAFLAAFEPDGRTAWSRSFGGDFELAPARVRAVPGNQIFVTGTFSGTADLGAGPVTSAGRSDAFVLRLDHLGRPLASAHVGSPFADEPRGAAVPVRSADADPPLARRLRAFLDELGVGPKEGADAAANRH